MTIQQTHHSDRELADEAPYKRDTCTGVPPRNTEKNHGWVVSSFVVADFQEVA